VSAPIRVDAAEEILGAWHAMNYSEGVPKAQ